MPLKMTCPNPSCAKRYSIPDAGAGRSIRCKGCGETFVAGKSVTVNAAPANDDLEPAWGAAPARVPTPGPPPTALGETVGRFAIRGKLGAGAFGTVYRAYDPHLDREVALKVPNAGATATAKQVERFLREAKAAAGLRHPHIVPVFDAGKDGDRYYIASAFIDGKSLADDIPEGGTDFARAARLARELADALAYAHDQGVVHRDVKPQNVMVDRHDRVHLMDFGLASRQDAAAKLTNDGAVMGTPAYMAPEQAAGQKGEAQPAADQYAVGVVLYELLTGRAPFAGPLAAVVHNVIHTAPDSPRKSRPDVPKDLETICLKAMAKRPEDRYAACHALAADLRRWLEGEPITARRLGLRERATRWVKKEPKLSAAVAVVALVLLVSFGLVSGAASRANAARRQAENALEEVRTARAREEQAAEKTLGAIGTAREERQQALKFQVKAGDEKKRADDFQVEAEDGRKKAAALQAQVEKERKKNRLQTVDVATLRGHTGGVYSASFSPDGARVVTASADETSRVWDAKTGAQVFALKGHTALLYSASFSPDGARVATASGDWTARVWDAQTGVQVLALKGHTNAVHSASFSPDGARVVTASADKTARVWDARTGSQVLALKGHTDWMRSAAFSADGTRVVTGGDDMTARVWDAKTGAEVLALKGHAHGVYSAAFSPDGARVVTASADGTARVWDAKTGAELFTLKGHTAVLYSAAFSPDGMRVVTASADMTARVWDARTGSQVLALKGHTDWMRSAAFSADGTRVVTGGEDRTARIWDLALEEK